MDEFYRWLSLFLLATMVAGLIRVFRGPADADRMLAAQLFGTTGIAVLLVLAEAQATPALRDIALIFALLAVLAAAAFMRTRIGSDGDADEGSQ